MAAAVGKYAARKVLNSQMKKYAKKEPAGQYDPFYEYRTDPRTGRQKKYKKLIPSYIPQADAEILASVRKRAYRLDMALFNFLGIRFGWSSVIGLVPEVGDVIDLLMAYSLYRECKKVEGGLDSSTKLQMKMWMLIDFVIGLVPFVGDLLDASIKANTKNVRLLEIALDNKYKPSALKADEEKITVERRKRDSEYRPPAPATVYEDLSSDDDLPQHNRRADDSQLTRPEASRAKEERRGDERAERPAKKGRGSWFGGQRDAPRDVERGSSRQNTTASNGRR